MLPAASAQMAPRSAPLGHPIDQPSAYSPIPQRMITDLHDNPLAIGLYGFVARLYLVAQTPVPLSVPDVLRYDPTLSRGAVLRALARLIAGGYLIEAAQPGLKTRYMPAWGRVSGAVLAWNMEQSCLGRPRHVARLRLDRRLFDICMGKLVPHTTRAASITRYVTTPALALADVGCYALALAGLPRATPALIRLGAVREGAACPLPSDECILALISQRALDLGDQADTKVELTISGTRKLGIQPLLAPDPAEATTQPLFFLPPGMIGCLIAPMIGSMIGSTAANASPATTAASEEMRSAVHSGGITWESSDPGDAANPPPAPQRHEVNGGGGVAAVGQKAIRRRQHPAVQLLPDTETAAALQAINVKPAQIVELAHIPPAIVAAAIADGRARPGIRDLAGWVVSLLRTHRDYGWQIKPPVSAHESPEALSVAFARYAAQQEAARCAEPDQAETPRAPERADEEDRRLAGSAPQPLVQLWNDVQAAMRTRITRQEFNTWIRPAVLQSIDQGIAIISAPSVGIKEGLEQRYTAPLRDLLAALLRAPIQLRVTIQIKADEADACMADAAGATLGGETPELLVTRAQFGATRTSVRRMDALTPAPDHRPDWIGAGQWAALPAMLRAALIGSIVVEGTVQAISPHLTRLITTRYAREVVAIIGARVARELLDGQAEPYES
jgi:hypothetical protein